MWHIPIRPLVVGLLTFVPGLQRWQVRSTGGTNSARYCYSVWFRHLAMLHQAGLSTSPEVIAELGPGDSLGTGLAGLVSGAKRYVALDAVRYAGTSRNLEIFDELVELFRSRSAIPGNDEFPEVKPPLEFHEFPSEWLTEDRLREALRRDRLDKIRESLQFATDSSEADRIVAYSAPWMDNEVIVNESVDYVFSQAVLEHVDDLEGAYAALHKWMKPGGVMSHQIDFRSHGTAKEWNGHWAYSNLVWTLIRGRRRYLINRQPLSTHVRLMQSVGFDIVRVLRFRSDSSLPRSRLATPFRDIIDEDLTTSGAFVQAIKV